MASFHNFDLNILWLLKGIAWHVFVFFFFFQKMPQSPINPGGGQKRGPSFDDRYVWGGCVCVKSPTWSELASGM